MITTAILVRLPSELAEDLDEWRESQPVKPSKNATFIEAIRSFIGAKDESTKPIYRVKNIRVTESLNDTLDGVDLAAEIGTDGWDTEAAGVMDRYCVAVRSGIAQHWPNADITVKWRVEGGAYRVEAYTDNPDDGNLAQHDAAFASLLGEVRELAWNAVW